MQAVAAIVEAAASRGRAIPPTMALLIGLSGIDGSGKGHLAGKLVAAFKDSGLGTAKINVDGWLNLPPTRFHPTRPAECFYENCLRLDEMFDQLVLPLRANRRAAVTMDWVDETATVTRPYTYQFDKVDVIVVEGVYLFKRAYRPHFDLAAWIDCSWQTAMERALERAQEGLPPDATIQAYRSIYFPAQELHFKLDSPRESADVIVVNDPYLAERGAAGLVGPE